MAKIYEFSLYDSDGTYLKYCELVGDDIEDSIGSWSGSYSKTGYVLAGWTTTRGSSIVEYTPDTSFKTVLTTHSCPVYLYIVWKSAIPTITFDTNSGTFLTSGETQSIYNSTKLTGSTALSSIVETPTKPGYVFRGWSTTSTGSVQYTQASMPTISSDTTLYAIYEPDTTKVLLEKGAVDIILGKLK